jgi:general secretion pathway protein D
MRRFAFLLSLLLPRLAAAGAAPSEDETVYQCNKHVGDVTVTFKPEIELKELVTWAMGFSCKQFLYDSRYVTGRKVTLIAPEKMSKAEAYQLFLASLSTMGLAAVPKGGGYVIVEAQAAKKEAIPMIGEAGGGEQLVRVVVRPTYAKPEVLKAAFEPMRSDAGDVQVIGTFLLVTDYASHVHEMAAVTKLVDVPGGTDGIYTIPVEHADASKLASKVEQVLGTATPAKLQVDERTNTLIVASNDAGYQRVKALVERLDFALDIEGGAQMHVYQLGNAIADEVAKTMNDAIQNQKQAASAAAPKSGAPAEQLALQSQAHVIADKATNKLIVTASGRDFIAIQDVIRQLDEPRRQVYIETVVLEVEDNNGVDAGTSSHGAYSTGSGNAVVLGGVQTGTSTLDLKDSLPALSGLISGVVGGPLTSSQTILGTSIPSYAVLFTAIATASHTNFMSTPSIIAVDNEESKFHAGVNVPYKKGVLPASPIATTGITTTNIDRADLNFELDIKAHISADDNVLLEIKNDAKDLGTSDPELGPSWNTRGFETRVVVHDQQTVVLNGIAQEREVTGETKVPILGDIPLLGFAFKYKTHSHKRSNLLILMTPYIVKDQLDLQAIQQRKLREHDEFARGNASLDRMAFTPHLDYRRKRGLVEEINRSVQAVEEDTAARATLRPPPKVESGPVR